MPAIGFFDDIKLTQRKAHAVSSWRMMKTVLSPKGFGWLTAPEKDSAMAVAGSFLGLEEDFSLQVSHSVAIIEPKPDFVKKVSSLLHDALQTNVLSRQNARALAGLLLRLSMCSSHSCGRGQLNYLHWHAYAESTRVSCELRLQLELHHALMQLGLRREISLAEHYRPTAVVYTDAACSTAEGTKYPCVTISYLVLGTGYRSGGIAQLPERVLDSFDTRKTYIAHGESFAVYWAMICEKPFLHGRSILWFIDNLGVLSILCKGSAHSVDVGAVCHAGLLTAAHADMRVWWDHVLSGSNCADGGSRGCSITAAALNVNLVQRPIPEWPTNASRIAPCFWLRLLGVEVVGEQ